MLDTKALLTGIDLTDLIVSDLGQPDKVSGKYTFYHCPFHSDSNPSFAVTKDRYYCYGCKASGDSIEWLKVYRGMTFREALALLAGENPYLNSTGAIVRANVEVVEPVETDKVDLQPVWREIIDTCGRDLWSDKAKSAREYLYGRGLTDRILQSPFIRLGYSEGKKIAGVWVDRGIVIPNFTVDNNSDIDHIAYVKIRRGKSWIYRPDDTAKYRKLYGAKAGLYLANMVMGSDIVFVTEGELDALLLMQEAGQYVGVCTLGGASDRLDWGLWGKYLSFAKWFYIAYDNDLAGESGLARWQAMTGRAIQANVPEGKDITDAYLAGVDLTEWVFSTIKEGVA